MGRRVAYVLLLRCIATFALAQGHAPGDKERFLNEVAANPANSLAHFRLGEIALLQHNYQTAANHFRAAIIGDRNPSWVLSWSHVSLGRIFEATGQWERAISSYQIVVGIGDNTGGAVEEAARFLKAQGEAVPEIPVSSVKVEELPVPEGVYRVQGDVTGPVPVEPVAPDYSDEGRIAELEGTVRLSGVIGEDGIARDMKVTSPLGLGLDEKALEVIGSWKFQPGMHQGRPVPTFATVPVDFLLPSKFSRWRLIRASFSFPDGASRPAFLSVSYPPGAGISRRSMDHASVVSATGRYSTTTISFDIDEQGRPVEFIQERASDPLWGTEAIALVENWRFSPAVIAGKPVRARCTLTLVWGRRGITVEALRQLSERTRMDVIRTP